MACAQRVWCLLSLLDVESGVTTFINIMQRQMLDVESGVTTFIDIMQRKLLSLKNWGSHICDPNARRELRCDHLHSVGRLSGLRHGTLGNTRTWCWTLWVR